MIRKVTRRDILKYTGGVGLALAGADILAACGGTSPAPSTAAEVKGPLNIATVGGTWKDWQNECVAQPFSDATKVDVVWDVQTPVGISTRMVAAKKAGRTPPDQISKTDQFDIQFFDQQGLTSNIDTGVVTNWNDIQPNFRTPSWMTNHVSVYAMTWNSDKVKKPINGWFDMWDDTFKGKLAIPIFEWVGFHYLAALNTVLGGTADNVNPAFTKLKEAVNTLQPKFMNSVEHGNQLFTSGEIWIAPFWDGRTRNLQDQKVPVKYIYPKEGAISNASGFALNRGIPAERVRAANLFMQQVGNPDAQICFASKINYTPTNLKALAKLPASMERIKINQADMDKMVKVPWADYNAHKSEYLDRWNREIARV
jgi:putative spermidine/putrescine transport system substrate-binding protein